MIRNHFIGTFVFFFALGILWASGTVASELDSKTLLQKGAWSVELTHDTSDGTLWCSASTYNRGNQSFGLAAFDSGLLALIISDPYWSLKTRPIRFLLDIDYKRWTIDGSASEDYVSLNMNNPEKSAEFIKDLMRGNAVAVLNDNGNRLATFTLNGSYAALDALVDCWSRITKDDPFTNRTDPFGASTDPF